MTAFPGTTLPNKANFMPYDDKPDPEFDAKTSRLLRREALRRAAQELNTTSGPGLESMLERISAEVTADAAASRTVTSAVPKPRP